MWDAILIALTSVLLHTGDVKLAIPRTKSKYDILITYYQSLARNHPDL